MEGPQNPDFSFQEKSGQDGAQCLALGLALLGFTGDEMQLLGVSHDCIPFYLKMTKLLIKIFFLHLALEKN